MLWVITSGPELLNEIISSIFVVRLVSVFMGDRKHKDASDQNPIMLSVIMLSVINCANDQRHKSRALDIALNTNALEIRRSTLQDILCYIASLTGP